MAKVTPISIVAGISGKISKDDDVYYYTNTVTGEVSARKIGNKKGKEPTPAQLAQRAVFKEKTETLSKWFDENKPSDKQPEGSVLYQTYRKEMETEGKTNDFYHYVWHKLFI